MIKVKIICTPGLNPHITPYAIAQSSTQVNGVFSLHEFVTYRIWQALHHAKICNTITMVLVMVCCKEEMNPIYTGKLPRMINYILEAKFYLYFEQ